MTTLVLYLRLSSAGSEIVYIASNHATFFGHNFHVSRPGLKHEELRLVWDAYLAFERSRGHMLRALDVQRRLLQSFVSLIHMKANSDYGWSLINCFRSQTAIFSWLTFLLISVLICECYVHELSFGAHSSRSYSVGRLHSLKPLTPQELFLVTPKVIAVQPVTVMPSEKNAPLLPVPPRQDLPPMCVKICHCLIQLRSHELHLGHKF